VLFLTIFAHIFWKMTKEQVIEVLGTIMDPDLKKDLVTLEFIEEVTVGEKEISCTIYASNPALHNRKRMQEAVIFNLKRVFGNDTEINCVVKSQPTESRVEKRKILPEVKNIIAIASGKGGVGKSTITANLAGGLAKAGYRVGNVEGKPMINPVMSYGIKILSIGFFATHDEAIVWRGPMAAKAMTQLFTEAYWGELDYLLIDLPPGTGDIHLSLVQTVPLDGVVIVSTPQEVALADARKGVHMFKLDTINVPIVGLVENMAWFTPAELPDNKYYIFGRDGVKNLAAGLNERFLGHIPLVQGVRESGDAGRPAVFQENTPTSNAFEELVRIFVAGIQEMKAAKLAKA
jgi:ATP-binding protein involved in chromosome partitioning